jgi:hypothetical protein
MDERQFWFDYLRSSHRAVMSFLSWLDSEVFDVQNRYHSFIGNPPANAENLWINIGREDALRDLRHKLLVQLGNAPSNPQDERSV